jgi:hypothetical protein
LVILNSTKKTVVLVECQKRLSYVLSVDLMFSVFAFSGGFSAFLGFSAFFGFAAFAFAYLSLYKAACPPVLGNDVGRVVPHGGGCVLLINATIHLFCMS